MARSRLINQYSLTALIFCCALGPWAMAADRELLKIDINTSTDVSHTGWQGWVISGTGSSGVQSKTFSNGIKVALYCPWYATDPLFTIEGFQNNYWGSFSGDMAEVQDPGANHGDITMTISYLAPGDYTLKTYHNPRTPAPSLNNLMDVNDRVGTGPWVRQVTDFDQQHWVPSNDIVLANPLTLDFSIPALNTDYQAAFVTSFKHKTLTDPNIPTDWIRNVGICGFELISHTIRAAYGPFPAPEARIRYNTSYDLTWSAPDPYTPGDTLHYDVYLTNDANDLYVGTTTTPAYPAGKLIATNTAATTVLSTQYPALLASKDYYWRVDTWGLQGGIQTRTEGAVWHFDTKNQPPTLDLGADQVSVQGRQVTFTAVSTDLDELPPGRTITYYWIDRNDANDPNYWDAYPPEHPSPFPATTASVSFVLDPNDRLTGNGRTYRFNCKVSDGANTTNKDVLVTVYNKSLTNCEVIKKLAGYQTSMRSAGDLNDDCITDLRDLSIYVIQWLDCKAVNNVCP